MPESSDSQSRVELLADEFLARCKRGEKPTIKEYCAQHPELADEIRVVFEALLMVEDLKPGSSDVSGSAGEAVKADGKRLEQVGDYRILCEIGRGGMGVVYEAEQQALGRRVALKVLPRTSAGDGSAQVRFQREARAAARMHHTNIVPVFDVGQDGDYLYYAMQLIHGQGLDLVIEDLKRLRAQAGATPAAQEQTADRSIAASLAAGKFEKENLAPEGETDAKATAAYEGRAPSSAVLPGQSDISTVTGNRGAYFRSVAQIGVQKASALSHAHSRGIVHRDIKPGNLILDTTGNVWVTDFGLAKTGDGGMTHTGDILGTVRYMSPERFRGQCDVRPDVYALGMTLYEMVTLKAAYASGDRLKLIELIRQTEAASPRSIDALIPRDLETIVMKAIDKDAKRRYQSADEMGEDLQRFVNDEPIKARRIGSLERFGRWCRRNPAVASLLAAVALLLVAGTVVSMLFAFDAADQARVARDKARDADSERRKADAERRKALENAGKAQAAETRANERAAAARAAERLERRRAYGVGMLLTQAAWEQHQVDHFLQLLEDYRPRKVGDEDFRGFEWFYWQQQLHRGHVTLKGHTGDVWSVAFSGDGKRIVSASPGDQTVKVWDAHTGQELLSLKTRMGTFYCAAFSADGERIAAGCWDKTVKVWDAHTGKEVFTLKGHANAVLCVTFSADGKRIASADGGLQTRNGTVKVWDARTGKEQLTLKGDPHGPKSVAFSPDGKHIASGSWQTLYVWDAHTGEEQLTFKGHTSIVQSVSFSPDGKRIVSGSWDNTVKVWDAHSGQEQLSLQGHTRSVQSVAFSPEGKRIASGGWDQTVRLWDAHSGQEQHTLKGHTRSVQCVAFSPDGKRIASGGWDQTVRLWDAQTGQAPLAMKPEKGDLLRVYSVAFSADGKRIVSGGGGLDKQFKAVPGQIKVWDVRTGREQLSLQGHANAVLSVAFSPDRKYIASGSGGYNAKNRKNWGEVKVWDAHTGQELLTFKGHTDTVWGVAFSPDGARIASGSLDKMVKIWDAHTGRGQLILKGHTGGVMSVAFSRDGKRIVSGSQDQTAKVWDARTGKEELSLEGGVTSVAFSADGTRIAAANLKTVKVWDARTGEELFSMKGHTTAVSSLAFCPDSERFVSASDQVKVCDARTGQEVLTLRGAHGPVAFSADGKLLAAGSEETLKVWEARSGQEGLTLKGHDLGVNSVAFSADSKRIVSGSGDRTVKVWDAYTGLEALTLKGHTGEVSSVAFSADGKHIASGGHDRTVKLWDAHTGKQTLTFKGHTLPVLSVAFSGDGKRIASASWELNKPSEVKVWDAQTGKELLTLKGHRGWVKSVAFSGDGKRIAAGSGSFDLRTWKKWGEVKVWDARTGKELFSLTRHTARVMSVVFSLDGKRIVSGSEGFDPKTRAFWGELKVWDAQTGQELLALKGHDDAVVSAAFSADGNRIVSGSHDRTVKVWDAHTGQEQFSLKGHTGFVWSVALSPDGKRIASGSEDHTVNVWDAHTGQQALRISGKDRE
jgi:WD40 repeat protein/serine/threonine protein kinase